MVLRPTTPHVLARLRVRIHGEGKVRGFDNCRLRSVRRLFFQQTAVAVDEAQSSPVMTIFGSAKELPREGGLSENPESHLRRTSHP